MVGIVDSRSYLTHPKPIVAPMQKIITKLDHKCTINKKKASTPVQSTSDLFEAHHDKCFFLFVWGGVQIAECVHNVCQK